MRDKKFLAAATVLFCIVLFVGWYQFVHEPAQRKILSMNLETRRLRQLEREINDLAARHENLSAFVAAKERQLDEARKFLPTTLAQDKFIDELYRAAELSGGRLTAVQAGEISEGEVQAQVVAVNLESDYVSLLNFIRETLDGGRLVSLENFTVTSADGGGLKSELTFKIFAAPSSAEK